MVKKFSLPEFNYEVEIGKVAAQADGAAWFKYGETVVLATAVSAPTEEFPGFLPLTVDYREQLAAAGKIPGGYFKREGRLTDKEVLTSRYIDRAIRPLFPENYFNQLQVLATVYSVDKEHMPSVVVLVAASIALSISKIPFMGPIGAVEVARVDGEWIFNPTYSQTQKSDVRIVVAGTDEGINMVEGSLNEVKEDQLIDILFKAHDKIKKQVAWQKEIQQALNVEKEHTDEDDAWKRIRNHANSFLTSDRLRSVFIKNKVERNTLVDSLRDEFVEQEKQEIEENGISAKLVKYMFDKVFAENISKEIFALDKRIDERKFDEIRQIAVEVGLLPYTHGSSLFTRGKTQALATVTLGGGQDQQQVEDLMGNTLEKSFMLHYNFLPYSSGEVRFMRGPGRREIGHGYLAVSALEQVLPLKKDFPYTIRIVVDILESDGSTSMATVCSSTMALMNAGVPIRKMVSGIAMGLLQSPDGTFKALSDINGDEDAYGLMDFKVTGTDIGITAIQMDIKYKGGLPRKVFEQALAQSRDGRLHILKEMQKVMTEPSPTLSHLVPQIISLKISPDKIGAIIGSGGKIIKDITEKTNTTIDIESDGTVNIYGQPEAKFDVAVSWVKVLAGFIQPGDIYKGKIKRATDFGLFVEIAPGQDGLVHISTIPREQQATLAKDYPIDNEVMVQVIDYDEKNGRIRLRLINQKEAV
ncbi:MAG: polyribonucleotide nucleotidyltransferase [Candidatus Babeliales bacterium]